MKDIIFIYVGKAKYQILMKYVQLSAIFTLHANYSFNTRTYFTVERTASKYSLKGGRAEERRIPQRSFGELEDYVRSTLSLRALVL